MQPPRLNLSRMVIILAALCWAVGLLAGFFLFRR